MTRCKVQCVSVIPREHDGWDTEKQESVKTTVYDAEFYAVSDGTEENKKFFKSTPGGHITFTTMRSDHFIPSKFYYVDFTEAN